MGIEREKSARNQAIFLKFGNVLGEDYIKYVYPDSHEAEEQSRRDFVRTVARLLHEGTLEEKTQAIEALISSIEERTELFAPPEFTFDI